MPCPGWSCKHFSNIRYPWDLFPICSELQCSRRSMPSLKEKKELVWSKAGVGAGSGAAVAADTVEHTTWAGDRRYNTTNKTPAPATYLPCAHRCKWRCGEMCLDWRNGAIRASAVLSEALHTSCSRNPEQRQVLAPGLIWSVQLQKRGNGDQPLTSVSHRKSEYPLHFC